MVLTVKNLNFCYQKDSVLKNISFCIKTGEILCLLGVNGAGKSTLLKCIAKILSKYTGAIFLANKNIKQVSTNKLAKHLAYVPQIPPTSSLTVYETILLGRKPHFSWKATTKDLNLVDNIIQELSLQSLALKPLSQLSGGEIQKVIIARALVQEPKIILFDEPTSSLDLKNQLEIMSLIKKATKTKKISTIISIHDINLALKFGDRFIFINKNNIPFIANSKNDITPEIIKKIYGVNVIINYINKNPVVVPL